MNESLPALVVRLKALAAKVNCYVTAPWRQTADEGGRRDVEDKHGAVVALGVDPLMGPYFAAIDPGTLLRLLDALAAAGKIAAALEDLLRDVAPVGDGRGDDRPCGACHAWLPYSGDDERDHEIDCPVLAARKALEEDHA